MSQILNRKNKADLAYRLTEATDKGKELPAIVFLGGFQSDMEGTKAHFLEQLCKEKGQAFLRFDYRAHGISEGDMKEFTIEGAFEDTQDIVEHCFPGQSVFLVGSSMGGWVSLLFAKHNPEKTYALIGLAPAPDFTTWIEEKLSQSQKEELEHQGYLEQPNDYGDPYIISKALLENGRQHLLLESDIPISCPVRLIHGKQDSDMPWEISNKIAEKLTSTDVKVTFIDDADHRLSSPEELEVLKTHIEALL
ncbi:MAG: alpha/beta hydrolase [Pseudomonadota bacterium]